jgi:RimJ/RimL family protein N-acetyltransferase
MSYYRKISGEKCYLSPITVEDAEIFTGWLNDIEVTMNLSIVQQQISLAKEKTILERMAQGGYSFAIIDNQTDKIIGITGLHNLDHINRAAEIGLFIGEKEFWNRGYGLEATRLTLDYAFTILNLTNVMLLVIEYNQRAYRCYLKAGFKEIGRRRKAHLIANKEYDMIYMDILAEDFVSPVLNSYFSESNLSKKK